MPTGRSVLTCTFAGALFMLGAATLAAQSQPLYPQDPTLPADKYIWLEAPTSPEALAWVKAENERTAKIFAADPRMASYVDEAIKISEDPSRLPMPDLRGNDVYNLWNDQNNVRGLLRRTTIADYNSASPEWKTVLDVDALAKKENTSWVLHGVNCLYPGDRYCMVALSVGGEDASTEREFDLQSATFVDGGFTAPHSKQDIAWQDKDTLLISRNWGPGTMTASGYPFVVKEWKRGTPLDSAKEIFRGQESDISANGFVVHDAQGDHLTLFHRSPSFFENLWFVRTAKGLEPLAIPRKAEPAALLGGRLLIQIHEDWTPTPGGPAFTQGSLLSVPLAAVLRDPAHLKPAVVFAPTADEFLGGVSTTRSRLLLTTLKHVLGRAYVYTPTGKDGWTHKALAVPDNSAVNIATASDTSDAFFLTTESFLTPPSLLAGDAATGQLTPSKSQPPQFDASQDVTEQLYATSSDGTKVPYFVVHRKDMPYNGQNPTLLTAYGGFEVSMTPSYNAIRGKLWLEKGGVFVLANIRGGGEFGPAWHEAGLKTHRQRIYDDFAAVGQDLVTRKITSPRHLGIEGGSNGGLLMGVEFTQHPDYWNAVIIQVPLLDMLRFEHIAAGASWVGEYGSVSVPAERAFLEKISPYNQLKPGVHYPEPLIFTTTRDDRVGPQHARKFAAKMEEYHEPFLYDEITEGGHGAGADLKERARTFAETYVYLAEKLQ
ncbi:MAG TPA: prolyl oligopeptidase family serine peptidase [Acidobacteriaceae bacterium]|jgi:prolyl oligopeptidase|nr:prolyl oligopeptidase family serine peptidase [Acidobacteriaceae bacterium]